MADVALQIEVDTRDQAELIRGRIQRGLGTRGSIHLGSEAASLPEHHRGPGHVVTAIIVCDEPVSDAIDVVRSVLPEFQVTEQPATTGPDARLTIALR